MLSLLATAEFTELPVTIAAAADMLITHTFVW